LGKLDGSEGGRLQPVLKVHQVFPFGPSILKIAHSLPSGIGCHRPRSSYGSENTL
jgi:hypothetical protein